MYWINCKNYDKHNDVPVNEVVIANFDNKEDCLAKIDEIINNSVRVKRSMKYKDGSARIEFTNGRANEYSIGTDEAKPGLDTNEFKAQLDRIENMLLAQGGNKNVEKAVEEIKAKVVEEDLSDRIKCHDLPEESFAPVKEKVEETVDTQATAEEAVVEEKPKTKKKKAE